MEKNPTWTPVVALALLDASGRLLLQQRPPGKHYAGLWEFPGGKVEIGETPRAALTREIAEELGLTLDPQAFQPVGFARRIRPAGRLSCFFTSRASLLVSPFAHDNQAFGWFTADAATDLPLAPMDRQLLAQLALQ